MLLSTVERFVSNETGFKNESLEVLEKPWIAPTEYTLTFTHLSGRSADVASSPDRYLASACFFVNNVEVLFHLWDIRPVAMTSQVLYWDYC